MSMDPNTLAETMMKSEYLVSKYSDTTMVYSNTMGIRVTKVETCPRTPTRWQRP